MSDFSNAVSSQLSLQPTSRLETQSPIDNSQNRDIFAPQSWTSQVLSTLQATALLFAGGFLLTRITEAPGLEFQVAFLGVMLIAGGLAMLSHLTAWEA